MNKCNCIIFAVIILYSCSNSEIRDRETQVVKESLQDTNSLLRNCIAEKDSFWDTDNFIKYVVIDSFYTVKLQINSIDTLLPYKFNCSTPKVLVPSVSSIYKDKICLIRGSGQHYREFTVSYLSNNKLIMKQYETALAINLKDNLVAYQNIDSTQVVYIEDIVSNKKKSYIIPSSFFSSNLVKANLSRNKLNLLFDNNRKLFFLF